MMCLRCHKRRAVIDYCVECHIEMQRQQEQDRMVTICNQQFTAANDRNTKAALRGEHYGRAVVLP